MEYNMTIDKFWEIVEAANWKSDNDYNRIRAWFMENYTLEEALAFRGIIATLFNQLDTFIGPDRNPALGSDDSHSDLLHHIIGCGKAEFEWCLNDYELIKHRGRSDYGSQEGYRESFSYAITYKDDYKA